MRRYALQSYLLSQCWKALRVMVISSTSGLPSTACPKNYHLPRPNPDTLRHERAVAAPGSRPRNGALRSRLTRSSSGAATRPAASWAFQAGQFWGLGVLVVVQGRPEGEAQRTRAKTPDAHFPVSTPK